MKTFVVKIVERGGNADGSGRTIVLDIINARYAEDAIQLALSRHHTRLSAFGAERCFGSPKVLGMDYFHSVRDDFHYIVYPFADLIKPLRSRHSREVDDLIDALTGQNVPPEAFHVNRVRALKMLRRLFADGIPEIPGK